MPVVGYHPVAFVSFVPAERAVRGARARLSRTGIAEEMREAHRRRILGEWLTPFPHGSAEGQRC